MVRFLISVPMELRNELRSAARKGGFTLSGLIRQILWDWVKEEKGG